jgi:O-antigen/teichoic acid export membrane protein
MGTEALSADAGIVRNVAAPTPRALTRRASLSAAASLLDYVVKAGVTLIVTPLLVTGLGRSLYGVWEMLGRLVGYMSAADGRSTEALRLVVAQQQNADDPAINRRSVGAALTVWLILSPLVTLIGATLAWFSPSIVNAPAGTETAVRLTAGLLVVSGLLGGLGSVPESVLRGMNLGYKQMGLQAGLSIVWGTLAAWAVHSGLGLAGLGGSMIFRAALTGIIFWLLVRKYVSWFRVARPTRPDVKALFGMSIWLSAGDLIAKLLLASDVIILGAIISPAAVTTYVLTAYAARTALGIHIFTAGAAMPGFGGLLGQRQFDRAAQIRRELLVLTWLFVTAVGATVLAWNPSFLSLWVKDGVKLYGGPWVDLLIVLIVAQTTFIRTDAYIIDAALRPRRRVIVGAITVVVTLGLAVALTYLLGIIGLCLGLLAGRAIQSIAYPIIVHSCLERPARDRGGVFAALRLALVTALLFTGASWLGQNVAAERWLVWVGAVVATLALAAGLAVVLGPSAADRRQLLVRVRAMARGLGRQR